MEIRDEGIILDSWSFRDRDLIVALLTPNHGVLRGVFRRARGGRAPRAAAAQALSLVRCSAYRGIHAEMASIRDFDLIQSSFALTSDLARSTAAASIAEMMLVFCPEGEPAPKQFRLAAAMLKALLGGIDPDAAIAYSQLWLLKLGGWLGPLDVCADCQSDLSGGSHAGERTGVLCSSCAGKSPRFELDDIAFIGSCLTTAPDQIRRAPSNIVRAWLDGLARSAAETRLRALDFHRSLD